jgi:hypothetical protein
VSLTRSHDSGEADAFLYYVMPYVEGESLREKLNREKQLGLDETVHIAEGIAAALDLRDMPRDRVTRRDSAPRVEWIRTAVLALADSAPRIRGQCRRITTATMDGPRAWAFRTS